MAPKKKFSKEQIVEAAFQIAKKEGMDAITIRKVADQLESSIAPIYVNFKDIHELKQEVITKIMEVSNQMLIEQNSGQPFHDIGVASLRFAKEYSVLFRDLVMRPNDLMEDYDQGMGEGLIEHMKSDKDLKGLTEEELKMILLKMRIFSVGLSIMVANGTMPQDFTEEQAIELLDSTAVDVISAAHFRKNEAGGHKE